MVNLPSPQRGPSRRPIFRSAGDSSSIWGGALVPGGLGFTGIIGYLPTKKIQKVDVTVTQNHLGWKRKIFPGNVVLKQQTLRYKRRNMFEPTNRGM